MACFSPLVAYKAKDKKAPDKTVIVFSRPQSWRGEVLNLPCGQCVGCRLEKSRQWAVRCMHEAALYERNCFVTLTYDDEHLPRDGSLVKEDLQLFMKRLRREYGSGIRFYACGEYGESLGRPHYHALLFNHDFEDKRFFSCRNKNKVFTSESLQRLWKAGFCVVGDVSFESAAYVARYVMKKITGPKAVEHYGGRLPEFTVMSRGCKRLRTGGIGKGWFDRFKSDVFPHDRVVVRGHPSRPPRFYDGLLGREDPSSLALMKLAREKKNSFRRVWDQVDGKMVQVPENSGMRLLVKEVCKKAELAQFRRSLEEVI